ncbi:hypothetical protein A3F60_04790 [Candidatus Roizmanbacteria bacterium RIFCSPHIGHO2_12_FULL_39_8]|uniref:Uncharacterized protein n=2 Tax=Candidatus Roizmaniibacteriota TaxID=1752723 RepID=A0A1F7HUW7_9BACT|nr:MAG: hypothetical protein A3F60_04790 [Candidatus Roizmanbacteria bacterium RIFCSPHIGHO2_12_FULL_39_8]
MIVTIKQVMDIFAELAEKIIKEQENIIGPLALEQAKKVPGIKVDGSTHTISLIGNKTTVLENLVKQYEALFGQASVELCKDVASKYLKEIPQEQLPQVLR